MSLGAPSGPPAYTLSLCSSVYRKLYDLGANFTGHVVWGRSLSIRVFFPQGIWKIGGLPLLNMAEQGET